MSSPADVATAPRLSRSGRTRGPAVRGVLVAVLILLGSYFYWHLMLRWFFLQRDDFWLVSVTDDPHGRFGVGEFLWRWGHDWYVRNGRSSDALVRAMLRPGASLMAWVAPAVLTACFAVAWRWLPREQMRPTTRALAMVLLLTVVPLALLTAPVISGNTVFWAAGIGNYVVPTGMALLAASWWARAPRSTATTVLAAVTMLAAGALHELAGLTVFVVGHAWWLLNRRSVRGRAAWLMAASYAALVLGFVGPGRWRRLAALTGDETGVSRWVSSASRFAGEMLLQTAPVWAALIVGLAAAVTATWRDSSSTERRWRAGSLVTLGVAGSAAWLLARSWRSPDDRCSEVLPLAEGNASSSFMMLGSGVVAVVAAAILLVRLRGHLGDAPVLLGAGLLATLPLPMATGLCASRVWYPPLVWGLTLLAVVLATLVARGHVTSRALLGVTAVALVLAVRFLVMAEPALRANHASFMRVLEQVQATRETGTGTVQFPDEVPFPDYAKSPVYRLPSIACGFRTYYAVPPAVVLDGGHVEAGLPEFCPRPDDPRHSGG